jgi:lysophospholipid acyltransferase (LPLAT)-like uncharacterized protein
MLRGILPYLAYLYVTFVGVTTRLRVEGDAHLRALRQKNQRFIYAFWHQRQVFFTYTHRHQNAAVLVSRSRDGELIARTMNLSGIGACRGSSSSGGASAARQLMELLHAGFDLGLTPDGPRGPARRVKPGIIFLAQKLGVPILPLTNSLSRKLEFKKSWDRFQLPLPFGRAVIRYASPIAVGPQDDLSAKRQELEKALNAITEEADARL